ncbi:MAG TPA: bifunctional YncE family protein/alkaline phosphatase family protein [Planctomycetota bacterium]|nr:bifunctional YncE family protein/alkaline phosphatase family protein [Planctomycetota bacterium]
MQSLSKKTAALILCAACAACAVEENPNLPGKKADGSVLLPNQWRLKPAGTQVDLGDGAVNSAMHPGGRFLAIQHAGYSKHEMIVVDLQNAKIASRTALGETFCGVEFSADGKKLFCSGASNETILAFDFSAADGTLSNEEKIIVRAGKERGIPAGIAVQSDAARLYVASVWGQRITRIDLKGEKEKKDIPLSNDPNATQAPAVKPSADLDTAAATKRDEAMRDPESPTAPFPFLCKLDETRARLYVSLWAQACVAVIDLKENKELARWKSEEHPCEMLLTKDGKILYVANANRNTVSVLDTDSGKALETIWAAMHPDLPPGSTPISLALTPDEKTLFVANACTNNVAVINVEHPGKSESMGFIPAGWYPTSVRVTPDGKTLCVVNGKGLTSFPNPPKPPKNTHDYIGSLMKGTLSVIALPAEREKLKEQMAAYTATAYSCTPDKVVAERVAKRAADNPIPAKVGDPSPIKYVVYIIKENRTYDQVLGDLKQGNGDPKICLFPRNVTPNHHKLAEEFVLLDNLYCDGEVSADGHEWTCGAYATDFVEKFWPLSYGHDKSGKYSYPGEGNFPIATPAGGYIWDRAAEANVTYRSYGEWVANPAKDGGLCVAKSKALIGHIDEHYQSFDLDYGELKRAERFLSELKRFETEGDMPRLQIVRLPNDHTKGAGRLSRTPTAYVAENDLGLGTVVEALTHSKFWPQTAIFCIEDDAQNGPDHVDAHRTIAFVASPYCKRKFVDSSMYSTSSMLRTMELILGLKPMSQFDAAALPMFNSFQATADLTPFDKLKANVDLEARNGIGAWGSQQSEGMAFDDADKCDDLALNEIIWKSVRGANSPMPAPVRAAFVFAHQKSGDADDDDDDE